MSGLTGLIDTLLAAKLSQRLDVLAIKSEVEIAGPGPVIQVQKVDNDVRLLSNAALDRQIPVDAPGASPPTAAEAPAAQLSAAARAIGVLLAEVRTDAGPVRGTTPVWPSAQAPPGEALASALARAVATSGLFYESHLAQLAAGSRTLAQLTDEPQASWSAPAPAMTTAGAASTPLTVATAGAAPMSLAAEGSALAAARVTVSPMLEARPHPADGGPAIAAVLPADLPADLPDAPQVARTAAPSIPAAAPVVGTNDDGALPAPRAAALSAEMHAAAGVRADAARLQATYRRADAPAAGSAFDSAATLRAADKGPDVQDAAATNTAAGARDAAATVIHPQALTLVHQQLDLLATPVFRWSGQAWPGVPMEWSIHEDREGTGRHADPDAQASERRWTTTLSLSLPSLGAVDVRLSLTGDAVQARVLANEAATRAGLRSADRALARRLEDVGLRLQDLQVVETFNP